MYLTSIRLSQRLRNGDKEKADALYRTLDRGGSKLRQSMISF